MFCQVFVIVSFIVYCNCAIYYFTEDASQHGCCQTALRQTIPDSFNFIFEIDLRREFMITKLLMRGYPNRTTIIMSRVAITGVSEDGATTVCLQTVDPHNYIAQHYLDEFTEYLECSQPMKARYINIDAGSTWDIYHPCQADIYGNVTTRIYMYIR